MLTLRPLSGLQAALKRRASKTTHDFTRRGSICVYSTYSLPNSKSSMRRFASYEELAPIFKTGAPDGERKVSESAVVHALAVVSQRRPWDPSPAPEQACTTRLDAQLERIKGQLAELRDGNQEMSHRVESLHCSVETLCRKRPASAASHSVSRRASPAPAPAPAPTSATVTAKPVQCIPLRKTESGSSLRAIHEEYRELVCLSDSDSGCLGSSDSDSDSDEGPESFEDYCRSVLTRLGRDRPSLSLHFSPPPGFSFPALDPQPLPEEEEEVDPKRHLVLNNLVRCPTSCSAPLLDVIRNDLTLHDRPFHPAQRSHQRLSVVSCLSDSVLFSSQYRQDVYQ